VKIWKRPKGVRATGEKTSHTATETRSMSGRSKRRPTKTTNGPPARVLPARQPSAVPPTALNEDSRTRAEKEKDRSQETKEKKRGHWRESKKNALVTGSQQQKKRMTPTRTITTGVSVVGSQRRSSTNVGQVKGGESAGRERGGRVGPEGTGRTRSP